MGPISRAMKSGRLEEAYLRLVDLVGDEAAPAILDELLATVVPSPFPRSS